MYMLVKNKWESSPLMEDVLNPAEAKEMLLKTLEEKIKFYKLRILKKLVGNEEAEVSQERAFIKSLNDQKNELEELLDGADLTEKKVKLNMQVEIELVSDSII